ncbi:MAG: Eco57I restriction-modification methylase domain-containing protein [bacterium]|nr:Eco57I restriction-modification methylase domain-containing protein [bacterium]
MLLQLTDDEIRAATSNQQALLFDSKGTFYSAIIESYLFFAIALQPRFYTRTELAGITRAVNRLFAMPVMLLFQHGETITLSVINRRLHKRDSTRDVLEQVTLIKDIRYAAPHRAHIEILHDLSLNALCAARPCDEEITSFVALHRAWQKILDIQALNRRFFLEVRNWFYWARLTARFPEGALKDGDGCDSDALIRMLTRLIFCWFLREKSLLPNELFLPPIIEDLLRDWRVSTCDKDTAGRYYKAILQNLFFATLATPPAERKFRAKNAPDGKNRDYGDQRFFRHVALFTDKAPVEELYKSIPFLNGGLFENLDEIPTRDPDVEKEIRVDGFSDIAAKQPTVPDFLFFGEERAVPELAATLGERVTPKARGIFRIFLDYKFTVEENTPLEQDIALDPELLGRAFENLLAAVNPETGATARKQTGSFYTPREIVHYMAEEALVRYLIATLSADAAPAADLDERLRELVAEQYATHRLNDAEADAIVVALGTLKILDPACGSGAFPMGLLHLLVHVLKKLDPHNERWKAAKLAVLPPEMRDKAEQIFSEESFDYTRKLELIKDCIHGVDIQPSAIQISKLRFFLSLVIEQSDPQRIRPLPNLETKFVCANSLLGLPRPNGWELFQHQIEPKERALLETRARYFFAQTKKEKDACKAADRKLRRELSEFIKGMGGSAANHLASAVAAWDPYHGDRRAGYFDPESMFGAADGFDITIGNPPYVRADEQSDWNQDQRRAILESEQYETLWEKWDLFVPFIERAYKLLRPNGISTLIVSDAFCHAKYAVKPQNWFLQNSRILRLDFCSDIKIFDAGVHNLIYFFQKADGANNIPERQVHKDTFGNVTLLPSDQQVQLTYRTFFPEQCVGRDFANKAIILSEVCYLTYGLRPSNAPQYEKFITAELVSNTQTAIHSKRYVEGKHLTKWIINGCMWLEWGTNRAPHHFYARTFNELYEVPEKIIAQRSPGSNPISVYDVTNLIFTPSSVGVVPWYLLSGVRNNSLMKVTRYKDEKPPRPDLPKREELEEISRRFAVKYLLAVMNSSTARDYLRANRRSNIHLYPDDWKKLPIPDVSPEAQAPLVALVDQILKAKRANPQADIAKLEQEVDTRVTALYGVEKPQPASAPTSASAPAPCRIKR